MTSGDKKKKKLALPEVLARIQRYCAYQERSHFQVRKKLFDFGLLSDEVEKIIAELITDGFLNEERFAISYAGGKFRMKKWGRIKIEHHLKIQKLSKRCISSGLKEINDREYQQTLIELLRKKITTVKDKDIFVRRHKVARFAIAKGYEPDLVWVNLEKLIPG